MFESSHYQLLSRSVAFSTPSVRVPHRTPSQHPCLQRSHSKWSVRRGRIPSLHTHPHPRWSASIAETAPKAGGVQSETFNQTKNVLSSSGGNVLDDLTVDYMAPAVQITEGRKGSVLETTELLSIPESLLLTPKSAGATLAEAYPSAKSNLDSFADEAVLALGLLYERHLGEQSTHAALINELPIIDHMDCASLWSDTELEWLFGSPVWASAKRISSGVKEEYERAQAVFGNVDWLGDDHEEYKWASAVVDSRAVYVSQAFPLVLAPILHSMQMEIAWKQEEDIADPRTKTGAKQADEREGNTTVAMSGAGMFFSRRRVTVSAARPIDVGSSVKLRAQGQSMENEGVTNGQLLLERGKAVQDERAYAVEMGFELASLDRFREDKLDILSMISGENGDTVADDTGGATFTLRGRSKRGLWTPPTDMDAFLRLICLTGGDVFLLEPVFRSEVWGFMELPVSSENEETICQLVIGACDDALEEYVEDSSEDDGDEESTSSRRKQLAQIVVQGEKEVLKSAKQHYQRVLDSLDVLEYYAERRLKQLDLLRPLDESEIIDSESGAQVGRAFDDNYR